MQQREHVRSLDLPSLIVPDGAIDAQRGAGIAQDQTQLGDRDGHARPHARAGRAHARGAEAGAGVKQQLEASARTTPGVRVLDGRFMVIQQAMATPKGHPAGARYLAAFVEENATNRETLENQLSFAIKTAPKLTIQGGTTEVLRGIIARGLGLR